MSSETNKSPFNKRIFLIRHGETLWSKSKQHTGRTDIPLTPHGEEQAKKLKEVLKGISFSNIFFSPLIRAQKTCELAGLNNQAELSNDLLEWDYGDYEGRTTEEIRKEHPNWNLFKNGVPNGETLLQVSKRADRILERALNCSGDVALFSSGHISRIIGSRWINLSPEYAQYLALSTASISILSYEHDWKVIQTWNTCSFLS